MRIGIVTTWQERGAAYVSRQYRDALRHGHEVFIYARGGEGYAIGDKNWDDASVTWGKKIPLHIPMSIDLADFKKWIIEKGLDIVFFNEQQWWEPVLLCNSMGIMTGTYVDYYTQETVPFFQVFDFLICNTKRHFSVFEWHPQAIYLPWGTNTDIFDLKSEQLVNPELVTFFHSAGVSPERKGTDILLKAFYDLKIPAKLIIHSQINLKDFYKDMQDLIDELEESGKLTLIEKTVPAPGLYHLGDIYVYPSRLDGIGLSLPEAMACGLPVITTDCQPMNEFVDQANSKLIKISVKSKRNDNYYWPMCEPEAESLTDLLTEYANNIKNIPDAKRSAREYAVKHLDWKINSMHLSELIEGFKIIPQSTKIDVVKNIMLYENNRASWQLKLYKKFPFLFKPFDWLWPLIKLAYVQK
ncbi:MAG: glycosyl transferase [Parcubacteria group bacterium GW2011_GWE2_39_37]|uniref:Glycosyl transferase n=1 Tax=Candidatus Falkowbacteria bacterium GW2011_GWF2_39_8 TaxID=1618642 RepID=A0A0G0Q2X2_9BACT|nr:MAG: glycosyl transferase [Parcubacteria group bacterium GW2011_GWE2_39_37]KKR31711.1 MAG: glycosyl transferase [Candidatus Falkowbacteria bacterium GW2011_GWF2_39_8]